MDLWNQKKALLSLVFPGGILLLAAVVVFQGAFGPIPTAAINLYYYAVFAAGVVLAWRFHSSRILFALLTLVLAHRALEFFSSGRIASGGPGGIALEAIAFLVPLNFVIFSTLPERGLTLASSISRLAVLLVESVFVAIICRPGEISGPAFLHPKFLGSLSSTHVPGVALLTFLLALTILGLRFRLYGKPTESGLLWASLATLVSIYMGGVGPAGTAYWATAGLILLSSIVENSYFLAYHDELTTLPARRAFNDAMFNLEEPYAVAVVDIDHFKNFNDTYGHETGDQVLRMVAAKLAGVTGGGRAYRVGGEEFCILFRGKTINDVLPHLELLRSVIQESRFRVREGQERRQFNRGQDNRQLESRRPDSGRPERRSSERRSETRRDPKSGRRTNCVRDGSQPVNVDLSVTVSIGVAEPTAKTRTVEEVIQAADKALYRAKQTGRNRVERSTAVVRRARSRRNIA